MLRCCQSGRSRESLPSLWNFLGRCAGAGRASTRRFVRKRRTASDVQTASSNSAIRRPVSLRQPAPTASGWHGWSGRCLSRRWATSSLEQSGWRLPRVAVWHGCFRTGLFEAWEAAQAFRSRPTLPHYAMLGPALVLVEEQRLSCLHGARTEMLLSVLALSSRPPFATMLCSAVTPARRLPQLAQAATLLSAAGQKLQSASDETLLSRMSCPSSIRVTFRSSLTRAEETVMAAALERSSVFVCWRQALAKPSAQLDATFVRLSREALAMLPQARTSQKTWHLACCLLSTTSERRSVRQDSTAVVSPEHKKKKEALLKSATRTPRC